MAEVAAFGPDVAYRLLPTDRFTQLRALIPHLMPKADRTWRNTIERKVERWWRVATAKYCGWRTGARRRNESRRLACNRHACVRLFLT